MSEVIWRGTPLSELTAYELLRALDDIRNIIDEFLATQNHNRQLLPNFTTSPEIVARNKHVLEAVMAECLRRGIGGENERNHAVR